MITLQPLSPSDQDLLREALYEALWDPPGEPRRPQAVLEATQIAAYVEAWGSKAGDLGFKAVTDAELIAGVVWSRLLRPPLEGGAYHNSNTPQLGIAVFPPYQGRGFGNRLLEQHLQEASRHFEGISLGVHPENSVAVRLYQKWGFKQFGVGEGGYLTLYRSLPV